MTAIKQTFDIRSLILGVLATALIFMSFAHTTSDDGQSNRQNYIVSDFGDNAGKILVLNDNTGEFIIMSSSTTNGKWWVKGDFASIQRESSINTIK